MFTGLIEDIGTIQRVTPRGNYLDLTISSRGEFRSIEDGESIAVSGPCLTVTSHKNNEFIVSASQETVRLTTLKGLRTGSLVNLERAMRADSRFGGHMVMGHIDCTARIIRVKRVGLSLRLEVELPDDFKPLVVDKGSITLDGVSLTITAVGQDALMVNMIPETQKRTTLTDLRVGDLLNVEYDLIGKYLNRFREIDGGRKGITIASMRRMGF